MVGKAWRVCAVVTVFVFAGLASSRADETPASSKDESGAARKAPGGAYGAKTAIPDEGKLEAFKGKKFNLKEKGEAAFMVSVAAGKEVTLTVSSEKKSDVNLFVYDLSKKEIAKDVSPGPDCKVTFTPKDAAKVVVVIRNLGPGENSSTIKATVAK
jgi:hypothetical protein